MAAYIGDLIAKYCNVTPAVMFGNVLHVIQIMHINSVLDGINQATLKSENYVLAVFMHSVTCLYQQLE